MPQELGGNVFVKGRGNDDRGGVHEIDYGPVLTEGPGADTLGDGLYEFGRTAEARSAYRKALEVNSTDVRARYNLAWVFTREKNFPAALGIIAEALALDKTGEYRERLLQKQSEVLAQLAVRNQQEYLLLINLVSKYAKKEAEDKPKPPEHTDAIRENGQQ